MPIYEYRCEDCKQLVSILVRESGSPQQPVCPLCGGEGLSRRYSTFRVGKGDTYRRKDFYDGIFSDSRLVKGLEANDPRALAEWSRKMTNATDGVASPEYEDVLGKLEAGEPTGKVMAEVQSTIKDSGGEE